MNIFSNPLLEGTPLTYKTHTYTLLLLGLLLCFQPLILLTNPLWIQAHQIFGLKYVAPSYIYPLSNQLTAHESAQWINIGLLMTVIGVVHMAAASGQGIGMARVLPGVRVVAAGLCAVLWVMRPEGRDLIKGLLMVEDGVMGMVTGRQMGVW